MNLKYISYTFLILLLAVFSNSCKDDDEEEIVNEGSKDVQIYSFSLTGTAKNKNDSIYYPIMAATKFAIDQNRGVIYNPDSLNYLTRPAKFLPTIKLGPTASVRVQYGYVIHNSGGIPQISYEDWTSTDSVDFSKEVEFKITALNSSSVAPKTYSIYFNVHQIDPDTIVWTKMPSFAKLSGSTQKTVISDAGVIYNYVAQGGTIQLRTSNTPNVAWGATTAVTGLPATTKLESLTIFGNAFYVVDAAGDAYSSANGMTWVSQGNTKKVFSVLGVLPRATAADDSLLVITNTGGVYHFAKTVDLAIINPVDTINKYPINVVDSDFPATGFSSSTNYNRSQSTQNMLLVSGGTTFGGQLKTATWLVTVNKNNILEMSPTSSAPTSLFVPASDFKTFVYGSSLYGITNDSVYVSDSWGYKWAKSPSKQDLPSGIKTTENQSVIVDKSNYIWIIGDMKESTYDAWRGRLNKLIK